MTIINEHNQSKLYNKLCTEFYILDKQPASGNELDFYAKLLQPSQGPWLEAMCGSGRLLIPLLKQGINIDGVDNSDYMLQECKKMCLQENADTQLFNQSITELSLPKKYAGIIIACGSFQLLNRKDALAALILLREHLMPEGFLLLEMFIPWDALKICIDNSCLLEKVELLSSRSVTCLDNSLLKLTCKSILYPKDQHDISYCVYKKYSPQGELIETEESESTLRWYYRYEIELLLEKAGFSAINMSEASLELNPQALIIKAIK